MTLLTKVGLLLLCQAAIGAVSVGIGLAVAVSITTPIAFVLFLHGLELDSDKAQALWGVISGITWLALTAVTLGYGQGVEKEEQL